MKRLVLSLSLFLCFQPTQALDAQLFNSYIEDIRNTKLDAVGSYLEQNKNSAETDQDYTVIYLNDFLAFSNQKLGAMGGENWLVNVSEVLSQYYPNKVYGYVSLGSLYGATKRYDEARKYYEKALKIDPDDDVVKQNTSKLSET